MTLIIERLNGDKYNLLELGIRVVDFEPESPNIRSEVIELDGGGVIVSDMGYGSREINANFLIHNYDLTDYAASRSDFFRLLSTTENFYIIDTKESFKRWLVRTNGSFSESRAIKTGSFSVSFICVRLFAESVLSTLDIQSIANGDNLKQWDIDVWTWNSGLDWDSETSYEFSSNTFQVNNIGDVAINPERWPLEITIKGFSQGTISLVNTTNGNTYEYRGGLNSGDTLVIKGVRSFKNGVSVFADTNYQLISLETGINNFSVSGGYLQSISFDFRYPYK